MSRPTTSRSTDEPLLVGRARELAAGLGFERSSSDETGRLLAVLVAARPGARIAEIGTGCGVAAAWMATALRGRATLVSVELDRERAAAAAALFAGRDDVEIVQGGWSDVLPPRAPFELLFFDGGQWKADPETHVPAALELLADGGLLVADDLSPSEAWPGPDPVREFFAGRDDLHVTEVGVSAEEWVVLAARTMEGRP